MMTGLKFGIGAVVLSGLLGFATPAYASCSSNVECKSTIELLYPSPQDDQVYVDLEGSLTGLTCAPVAGKYFVMALNTDTKRATWQLLVSALLSGKAVTVRLNATSSQCNIQYVTVAP